MKATLRETMLRSEIAFLENTIRQYRAGTPTRVPRTLGGDLNGGPLSIFKWEGRLADAQRELAELQQRKAAGA